MSISLFEEKYRPGTVNDVLGNDQIKKEIMAQIKQFKSRLAKIRENYAALETETDPVKIAKLKDENNKLKSKRMRHQIFSGNAGVGKTTMAIAIGKDLYGSDYGSMFHEFNASDERSIAFVRETIKGLSQEGTGEYPFMIIFLDEADNLTDDAQNALKRIIEKARRCVFILACNNVEDIIEPLKSRCSVRKFKNISMKVAVEKMSWICEQEGIEFAEGFLEELYLTRSGDLRNCIGKLGEMADLHQKLTIDMIDEGVLKKDDVKNFYTQCVTGKLRAALRFYQKMRIENSINQVDFINAIEKFIINLKRSNEFKSDIMVYVSTFTGQRDTDIMIMAIIGKIFQANKNDEERPDDEKTFEQKPEEAKDSA